MRYKQFLILVLLITLNINSHAIEQKLSYAEEYDEVKFVQNNTNSTIPLNENSDDTANLINSSLPSARDHDDHDNDWYWIIFPISGLAALGYYRKKIMKE